MFVYRHISKLFLTAYRTNSLQHILKKSTMKYLNANHANNNSFINPQKYIDHKRHAVFRYKNTYCFTNMWFLNSVVYEKVADSGRRKLILNVNVYGTSFRLFSFLNEDIFSGTI